MSIDRVVGIGGVTVGLVGTGIVVLWPDKRWLGWVFIALGLLIAGLSTVWALAVWHARREFEERRSKSDPYPAAEVTQTQNAPINNNPVFAPVFAPNFNQSQSQTQTQEQSVTKEETVQSEIECTDCYFVRGMLSGWNRLTEDRGQPCMVAQADFHLKPIPGSEPWMELRTQFVFYDASGSRRIKRVSDGVWRKHGNYIQMPLNTGDTRRLVIALELNDTFNTYEYAEKHSGRRRFTTEGIFTHILAPIVEPLNADALTVQVRLIGKYLDKVTLDQEFWFSLSRPKLTIEKISSPREKETEMKTHF